MCVCPQCRQVCSCPPITFAVLFCRVVCLGPFLSEPCISCLPWLSLFRLACALLVWLPFLGGFLSFVAAARCFVLVVVFCLPLWLWCLRFGPLFPVPPPPLPPWLSPGVFWPSQCSAVPPSDSGCICNGPVVIPLVLRVVVDWLLSSLRSLATKAAALCGALPSTPCCGCCSCAPRSVTEVFALV